jgi:hypothetical protein
MVYKQNGFVPNAELRLFQMSVYNLHQYPEVRKGDQNMSAWKRLVKNICRSSLLETAG